MKKNETFEYLDKHYIYQISTLNNETQIYHSLDELITFLKSNVSYWKKIEANAQIDSEKLYSVRLQKIIDTFDSWTDKISIENASNVSSLNIILNQSKIGSANTNTTRMQKASNIEYGQYATFNIFSATFFSNSTNIALILVGYKQLYLTNNEKAFTSFYSLVHTNGGNIASNLNSNGEIKEATYLYLGLAIKNLGILSSEKIKAIEVDALKSQVEDLQKSLSSSKQELQAFVSNQSDDFKQKVETEIEKNETDRTSINDAWTEKTEIIDNDIDKRYKKLSSLKDAFLEKLHLEAPIEFWT